MKTGSNDTMNFAAMDRRPGADAEPPRTAGRAPASGATGEIVPNSTMAVSVVFTVRNDAQGCRDLLDALGKQSSSPGEIIVVDGGSTDRTREIVRTAAHGLPQLRWIELPGANISQGRNAGIAAAGGDVIALTDSGCMPATDWLEKLTGPFRLDPSLQWVGGSYRVAPRSTFERVVGLATMRGQLDPIDPATFNPSARSMAFRKHVWSHARGFPEWLYTAEDTLFDLKLRRMGVPMRFAGDAVVEWRPRSGWRALARQFYLYARGNAHARLDERNGLYNLRNVALLLMSALLASINPVFFIATMLGAVYFFVRPWHGRCMRIARRMNAHRAYATALAIHWVVAVSDALGCLTGLVQRVTHSRRYRHARARYLELPATSDTPQPTGRPGCAGTLQHRPTPDDPANAATLVLQECPAT